MADETVHYIACNPDAIWNAMNDIYAANGGDVLFPGDEKYMLLRAVQQILVTAYAAFDNAARMRTVRYAVGDYLDLIAENMRLKRNEEEPAKTQIKVTMRGASGTLSIPTGTLFSYNGMLTFETTEYAATLADGEEVSLTVPAQCVEGGEAGNGIKAGELLQPIKATSIITRAEIVTETAGGRERETDDAFRERLLKSTFNDTVTGPELQYRAKALGVSSGILDASAVADSEFSTGTPEIGMKYGLQRGEVLVCLRFADSVSDGDKDDIIAAVYEALNTDSERPLTDKLTVREAEVVPFALKVRYMIREGAATDAVKNIMSAAAEYETWQCAHIGLAFDPYRLMSMLYNAECARVEIVAEESNLSGGPAAYTAIAKTKRLKGNVTLEEIEDE